MADTLLAPDREIVTRKQAVHRGLKNYWTGKPCPSGHISERQVSDHKCAECRRIYRRKYLAENPDKGAAINAEKKERYHSDPEYRAERIRKAAEWGAANKDRKKAYLKLYYVGNKETSKIYGKARYDRNRLNPEWVKKERLRNKIRHQENPEVKRSYVRRRRAQLRKAEGSHNAKDILRLLDIQKRRCAYCSVSLKSGYDVDHIIPLSRGGSNWPNNLQCLCPTCNGKKWAKDPIDFAQETGRLL